jgi:hypothetical protein
MDDLALVDFEPDFPAVAVDEDAALPDAVRAALAEGFEVLTAGLFVADPALEAGDADFSRTAGFALAPVIASRPLLVLDDIAFLAITISSWRRRIAAQE